jgi:hypothetical protein
MKRKAEQSPEGSGENRKGSKQIMDELKTMMEGIQTNIKNGMDNLNEKLDKVLEDFEAVKAKAENNRENIDDLYEKENILSKTTVELEKRIEMLEKQQRKNNIIIKGFPYSREETFTNLQTEIQKFFRESLNINPSCIVKCLRVGKAKYELVILNDSYIKGKIFMNFKTFKDRNPNNQIKIGDDLSKSEADKVNMLLKARLDARAVGHRVEFRRGILKVNGVIQEIVNGKITPKETNMDH